MQHRKTWSEEESAQLRTQYIEKGRSPAMAAVHFKCSKRAVFKRAAELGLKFLTARERREQLIGSARRVTPVLGTFLGTARGTSGRGTDFSSVHCPRMTKRPKNSAPDPRDADKGQGIVLDEQSQEQPADKERARKVSRTDRGDDPPGHKND